MPSITSIQWTDATWNPLRGCSRVSEGCRNCYAERIAARFSRLAKMTPSGPRWSGEVQLVESLLTLPLRWKAPRRVFVNSMSDLFHEKVADDWIWQVYGVMSAAPQHTFQILTKRPERMQRVVSEITGSKVPCPNVWLGVSAEDQKTFDERVEHLGATPAAVRFVSLEPLLEQIDFGNGLDDPPEGSPYGRLDWVIVGGESGPGARPFDLAWARATISQCRAAGVPVFCKQLGARPFDSASTGFLRQDIRDRKGGDMDEWPEDLRVREFPR